MTLRQDAIAAYQASQNDRATEARQILADTLAPEDVSGLAVADIDTGDGYTRFVFTDGDVDLAVVLRGSGNNEVHLVTGEPGEWTDLALIDSLETLGKVLPDLAPLPPAPSGPDPWAPQVAYAVGDEVTYGGSTYQCRQAHQAQIGWEPPNVPALWTKVAG